MHVCIFMSVAICIYRAKHVFIVMSLTLIHYHMDNSSLLPLLVYMSSPTPTVSDMDPIIQHHLIAQCKYNCIAVSELLICTPVGTSLSTRVQCLYTVSVAYSITHIVSSFTCQHLYLRLQWDVLYTWNTIRLFCQNLHSILRSCNLLN